MATLIVKITHGTEIRRFTSNSATLSWSSLSKRVGELFALSKYKLTYVDDEGDKITLSSEDEFTEAVSLALKTEPAVLRLGISVEAEKKAGVTQSDNVPMADASTEAAPRATADAGTHARPPTADAGTTDDGGGATRDERDLRTFLNHLATQLPTVISQLPEGVRRLIPRAELDVAATLAANAVDNASCAAAAAARAGRDAWAASAATTNASNDSDADGARLSPESNIHPGVTCDRSGMCPIVGDRYNLVGHNYDLCEAEYNKLSEREKGLYQKVPPPFVHSIPAGPVGVHPGVECDRSGVCPIVGMRYNLRGHNYDLCQAEYDKLAAAEKLLYTAIPPPLTGAGAAAAAAACGAGGGCSWRQSWGGGGRSWGGGGRTGRDGEGGGGREGREGGPKLAARFVRDVTIFDGTQMAPSTKFTKIWRLKNIGEVAWPPGTKMLYVGGDQMTSEMSVPLSRAGPVLAGEEVDVAVEMVAPSDLGRYLGYWRLVGPHGRRKFGQRVWCHVQVVDPAAPDSLASTDDELKRALAEIEKKKSALAATDPDGHEDEEGSLAGTEASSSAPPSACSPSPAANKPCGREGCAFAVTWHKTHCCNMCANGKGHGGRCAKKILAQESSEAAPEPMATEPVTTTTTAAAVLVGEPVDPIVGGAAGGAPAADAAAVDVADRSDDGMVLVTEGMCLEPEPAKEGDAAAALDKTTPEGVKAALAAMGFLDASMVEVVLAKHGADLDACARDLAAATEWDSLLDDLAEMGFEHRDLNRTLLLKHDGNVKRTVKALVEDA